MAIDPKKQLPGGPQTANEVMFDAVIRHQIHLLRMSGGIRNDVVDILNATERDLAEKIRGTLGNLKPGGLVPANQRKVKRLMKQIQAIRSPAWEEISEKWFTDFEQLTKDEAIFMQTATGASLPVTVITTTPSVSTLNSLVKNNPFEGRTLKEWATKIERDDITSMLNHVRIGIVQGETNNQIARRIVGTARLGGTDGVTQITRRQAAGITRTATIAFSNLSKREFAKENSDIIKAEVYTATLDGRTTNICMSLDGQIFKIAIGPIPPLHFNCRSVRVPYFDGAVLGSRPSKPTTEKQLVKEFTAKNGLSPVGSRAKLPRGAKGKFDTFARTRVRQLTGTVPAKVNYGVWLGRQSVDFQNEVLGVTKARLFRKGDLPLDRFVNRRGDELTLSQIAVKDKEAFIKAGLDPKDF